jgi:hypothetical protein
MKEKQNENQKNIQRGSFWKDAETITEPNQVL